MVAKYIHANAGRENEKAKEKETSSAERRRKGMKAEYRRKRGKKVCIGVCE